MNRFPRGSEWRKWDLHVHVPGTKLNDCYEKADGSDDFDRFADTLEASDVAAFGITDYFTATQSIAFIEHFKDRYPESTKLLLVNVELRLNETVNRDIQMVDLHVVFRDSVPPEKIAEFLSRLTTQLTDANGRQKACTELVANDFESATVTRSDVRAAFKQTFGDRAEPTDFLLYIAPANNNGLRAESGQQRKAQIADEIDKDVHAIFGKDPSNTRYFLRTNRFEDSGQASRPKPVFGGCDAHSFQDLENWLGKSASTESTRQVITWIKADPTFAGLQQTLVEPGERVSIEPIEPDQKEPYKVISKVTFSGSDDFPAEVVLNRNLNAIIGSRSSGKSAFLAHIAHTVDAAETVRLQMEAHGLADAREAGPAAGYSWNDVSHVRCSVEWQSGEGTAGKVIYIPQNSLYTLSEQPDEITKKIAPALFRTYPAVKTAFDGALGKVTAANAEIRAAVSEWFVLGDRIDERDQDLKDVGDKAAILAERDRLQAEVDRIKVAAKLTDDEVATYQAIAVDLDGKAARLRQIEIEVDQLSSYVAPPDAVRGHEIRAEAVHATVTVRPSPVELPEALSIQVDDVRKASASEVVVRIEALLVQAAVALDGEREDLQAAIKQVTEENSALISKHEANLELAGVIADHKKQVASLDEIAHLERLRDKLLEDRRRATERVAAAITDRSTALHSLVAAFNSEPRVLTDLKFGVEIEVPAEVANHVSIGFSQRSTNDYVKSKGDVVSFQDAQDDPAKFLDAIRRGQVTLNKGYTPDTVASDVLVVSPEVRFSAELDTDRIGGFRRSSMTPGKQALFALTLILNESQEPWPLLIDQPEDDLDSRSIYDTIVPYLMNRKKERQIIMVSHNANLVIGADSELVIVANRHGDDRKNSHARTFEYFTGALEHSQPLNPTSPTALGRFGIREHACEILDGGEEAFQKRRNKYKI